MARKNLLLLSMSTLHEDSLKEYFYEGNYGEKCYFRGVSQLEAGTKYYLRKLQNEGEKIDKIFIVASLEANEESVDIKKLTDYVRQPLYYLTEDENSSKGSAVQFYEERIYQYIQGLEEEHLPIRQEEQEVAQKPLLGFIPRESKKIYVDVQEVNDEFPAKVKEYEENTKSLKDLYTGELFEIIPLGNSIKKDSIDNEDDQDSFFEGVHELCDQIQKYADDSDENEIKLYLDTQGSFRTQSFIINAALRMLEMHGIKVEESITTSFYEKNNINGKFNKIIDSTFNDRIFELVSGMNEFIETGRGETLYNFWKDSKDLVDLKNEEEIITTIKEISDSISVCNVSKFDDSLKHFREVLNEYDKNKDIEHHQNPLFKTYVRDLRMDYDKNHLLDEESSKTEDQIRWCLRKKLYQQALTILEAKIPDDIVNDKIIYYKNDNELGLLLKNLTDSKWPTPPNYLKVRPGETKKIKSENNKYVFINYVLKPKHLKDRNGQCTWQLDRNITQLKGISINGKTEGTNKNDSLIGKLLNDYQELSDLRNSINHANGEKIKEETVKENSNQEDPQIATIKNKINDFFDNYKKLDGKVNVDISEKVTINKPPKLGNFDLSQLEI